jgi:hypothetical protein
LIHLLLLWSKKKPLVISGGGQQKARTAAGRGKVLKANTGAGFMGFSGNKKPACLHMGGF